MRVKQLIALLKEVDQDAIIVRRTHFGYGVEYCTYHFDSKSCPVQLVDDGWDTRPSGPPVSVFVISPPPIGPDPD